MDCFDYRVSDFCELCFEKQQSFLSRKDWILKNKMDRKITGIYAGPLLVTSINSFKHDNGTGYHVTFKCLAKNTLAFDEHVFYFSKLKRGKFWPGDKLTGIINSIGSADFIGQKVENMRVCTANYHLAKLMDKKGDIVYKGKKFGEE